MAWHLSETDIATALIALFAAVLAATKDVLVKREDGKGHTLDFNKLNLVGRVAIGVATIAFFTTLYNTNKTKDATRAAQKELKDNFGNIDKTSQQILSSVKGQLDAMVELSKGELKQIDQLVSEEMKKAEETLDGTISRVSQKLESKLGGVEGGIMETTGLLKTTRTELNTTRTELSGTLKDLSNVAKESKETIDGFKTPLETTQRLVTNSETNITKINNNLANAQTSIEKSAQKVIKELDNTIGTQIALIPLQIEQNSKRTLPGRLSGLEIIVGDVHKNEPFEVKIVRKNGGPAVKVSCDSNRYSYPKGDNACTLNPKMMSKITEDKSYSLSFTHNGYKYDIQMWGSVPSNLFGKAPDSLICQIIEMPASMAENKTSPELRANQK